MLMFSARSDRNNPEYTAPEEQHLAVGCVALQGDGSADSPLLHEVTIRNDGEISWNGIIRLPLLPTVYPPSWIIRICCLRPPVTQPKCAPKNRPKRWLMRF